MYNRRHDGPCISGVLADEDYDELLHCYCEDPLNPDALAAGAKAVKLASKHGSVTTSEEAADWMMVASLAERTVSRAAASNAAKRAASLKAAAPPSPKAQRRRRGTAATPHSQKRDSRRLHPWQPEAAPFGEPEPQRATSWHPERTRSQPAAGGDDARRTVSWKLDSLKSSFELRLQRQPQPSGVRHPRDAQPVAPAHKARRRRTGAKGHAKPAEVGPTPTCCNRRSWRRTPRPLQKAPSWRRPPHRPRRRSSRRRPSGRSSAPSSRRRWREGWVWGRAQAGKGSRPRCNSGRRLQPRARRRADARGGGGSHTYRSFTRRLRAAEEDLRLPSPTSDRHRPAAAPFGAAAAAVALARRDHNALAA